jgi:hypothetical protein
MQIDISARVKQVNIKLIQDAEERFIGKELLLDRW